MRRFLLLAMLAAAPLRAQQCPAGPVALVLSGGGAKGLAHIGVLRVLDSLGVRPDLIVGSSIGAVIGAMYASGYSGREIDSLARALPLSSLFRAYDPRAPGALGALQPLVVWDQGERGFVLQSAAIRQPEVNGLLSAAMLRGNLIARGNFDSLPIPFIAVATDLGDRSIVRLRSGDLARAVRASLAIPLIVPPEHMDGRVLADGGLSANIPIGVARGAGATRVIVSDATAKLDTTLDVDSPLRLADRLVGFLFQQPAEPLRAGDVRIRPDVDGFTSLDFAPDRVSRLIELGAAAARQAFGGAACHPQTRPRDTTSPDAARRSTLPVYIDTVITAGATGAERRALLRLLGLEGRREVDLRMLRARLRGLRDADAYDAIWLRPFGHGDTVGFDLTVARAPQRAAALGLAYDNELGGRMWVGGVDRNLFRLALEGSAALFLGELKRDAVLDLRRPYELGGRLVTPVLTVSVGSESIRQFDATRHEIPSLDTREARGFAGIERALGHHWRLALGAEALAWRQPVDADAHAVGAAARLDHGAGADRDLDGEIWWTSTARRVSLVAAPALGGGPLTLRPYLRLGWGRDLPLQRTFALGGTEGFPGLHIGELRGDREAVLGLGATWVVRRPFLLVAEAAVGRSGTGGSLLAGDGWIGGARVGIGADTPVGPMRFEYGRATEGREALTVRLGRWF